MFSGDPWEACFWGGQGGGRGTTVRSGGETVVRNIMYKITNFFFKIAEENIVFVSEM